MRPPNPSSLLLSFLLFSFSTIALPLPADPPLPGRTGTSVGTDGVVTGHYGDDWMPEHMRHVQDNQKEFPQNRGAFDVNKDDDRNLKIGNKPVGKHPVSGESRVKDEKPLNMQKIPGGKNEGTTFQPLSAKESGPMRVDQYTSIDLENRKKQEDKFREVHGPGKPFKPESKPKNPDGSLRTEAELAAQMKQKAGPGGKTKIVPNPGWSEMKTKENSHDPQLRAHEAPAVMHTKPWSKDPQYKPPSVDEGKKEKPKPGPKPGPQPAPPAPDRVPLRSGFRQSTIEKGREQPPPKPPADPKASQPGNKATDHPNYRNPRPSVPDQYKPGTKDTGFKSPTPGISPPPEDRNRLPPRPQNEKSGPPKPGPPRYPPPPPGQARAKDDSAFKGPLESGEFKKLPDGKKNPNNKPPGPPPPGPPPPGPPSKGPKPPGPPPPPPKPPGPKQGGTDSSKKTPPPIPPKTDSVNKAAAHPSPNKIPPPIPQKPAALVSPKKDTAQSPKKQPPPIPPKPDVAHATPKKDTPHPPPATPKGNPTPATPKKGPAPPPPKKGGR